MFETINIYTKLQESKIEGKSLKLKKYYHKLI